MGDGKSFQPSPMRLSSVGFRVGSGHSWSRMLRRHATSTITVTQLLQNKYCNFQVVILAELVETEPFATPWFELRGSCGIESW
jgi:hypothetical protein